MPETRGADNGKRQDHRATVLVLIGLCIALPHLYRALMPTSDQPAPEQTRPQVVWLERGGGQGDGLYWLDDPVAAWPQLLATFGYPAPAGGLPPLVDDLLPAYRLPVSGPPQAIPLPAKAAPLFMQKIPLNQADLETLLAIPGVGRRLAATIITHRDRTGGIKDRAGLMAIPGIGDKKAAIIEGYIRYE